MGIFDRIITDFVPPWFRGTVMRKLLSGVAAAYDDAATRALAARTAAIPYAAGAKTDLGAPLQCEPDVLEWHARDRGIRLYSTEPELSKRIRLSRWRQLWKRRGSHRGELENIQPYFLDRPALPRMRIVHQDRATVGFTVTPAASWHTLDSDGTYSVIKRSPSNWDWDLDYTKVSRFWLIIYTDQLGFTQPTWDGGEDWNGGQVWDGLFTSAQIDDIIQMVKEAKAAHSILWGVILATDPTSFDPTSTAVTDPAGWTSLPAGNWWSVIDNNTGKPTRLPSCSVVYNLGKAV